MFDVGISWRCDWCGGELQLLNGPASGIRCTKCGRTEGIESSGEKCKKHIMRMELLDRMLSAIPEGSDAWKQLTREKLASEGYVKEWFRLEADSLIEKRPTSPNTQ